MVIPKHSDNAPVSAGFCQNSSSFVVTPPQPMTTAELRAQTPPGRPCAYWESQLTADTQG